MSAPSPLRRRLVTIPRTVAFFVGLSVAGPVLVLAALVVDLARLAAGSRAFGTVRVVVFGWFYFAAEVVGLTRLLGVWLVHGRNRDRLRRHTRRIQMWFARSLFGAVRAVFDLTLEVDGLDEVTPGPTMLFVRHSSIVDTLHPPANVGDQNGMKLRWVLKAELLADPALDIAGNWLDNYFVDRRAGASEIVRIRQLGEHLADDEAVVIYPEGSRFTPERRANAIRKLRASDPELARTAETLTHVLPPRPGGALALLEAGTDVVVCGHVGLDGFAKVKDIVSGRLVGGHIKVWFRRIAAADIPADQRARVLWLFDEWAALDRRIAAELT